MSVFFQPAFGFFCRWIERDTMISKTFAVVHMGKMGKFVTDDIIDNSLREGDEFSV